MSFDPFIWIDLETGGLDTESCDILEIGILITNADLVPISSAHSLVLPRDTSVEALMVRMSSFVVNMHTDSGLLSELAGAWGELHSPGRVASNLADWLADQARDLRFDLSKQPMCGSSIGFDRRFLAAHMPALHDVFHYRNVDLSSVKEIIRRKAPETYNDTPPKEGQHRSIPDLYDTLREADHYFTAMGF